MREAAARVRALGASAPAVPAASAAVDIDPVHTASELARIAAAFEVTDAAHARLAASGPVRTVVRIDTVANIAVGVAPWGPFAVAAAPGEPTWLDDADVVAVGPDAPLADPAALRGPVLVVGKDLHRHPFAVAAIDGLRAVRDDVVTVDMGWPSDDRAHADVATFGASRLVGEALIALVAEAPGLVTADAP